MAMAPLVVAGQVYQAAHAPRIEVNRVTDDEVTFHQQGSNRIETVSLDTFQKWIVRVSARAVTAG